MSSHNSANLSDDKSEIINEFLQLLTANHHRIYGYILSLAPVRVHADDIMQEATLIMWKKFTEFKTGSDFVSWGITIARNLILNHRKNKNNQVLHFDDQVFKNIEARSEGYMRNIDRRIDALKHCVKKLSSQDRLLLKLRFESEIPAKIIAERLGRKFQTIYKSLARIQGILARCIRRTMLAEELL
ncbi:MAG: sigma-70 family RNA polymerase sigma factor [Sedimentisphaerales bacterium]|nr:sigma-70 family RNA polymerase sigma factor [Sedimentisphaerales bacterium]